jgi:hypothetical protein
VPRDQVFISYSHRDARWRDDLEIHLKPYHRTGSITSWSDQQIAPGSEWLTEIQSALANSKVAVLLVSPDFIASDFIYKHELGPLLKDAKQGGVRILWVPVRASSYEKTPLRDYQALHDPEKPLYGMADAYHDMAWVKICKKIEECCEAIDKELEAEKRQPEEQEGLETKGQPEKPVASQDPKPPEAQKPEEPKVVKPRQQLAFTATRYFLWLFWFPLLACLVAFGVNAAMGGDWVHDPPWFMMWPMLLVLFNLFLGPAVYAILKKKVYRGAIVWLNILLVFGGGFPALVLWFWAFYGKEENIGKRTIPEGKTS